MNLQAESRLNNVVKELAVREKAWVNRILQGDKAAGERLVTENYRRVYGLLRSLTGHREAAEDLTQQTFTKAWQGLASFRGESRLSTWLCRIAYHEYAHWRRDRREIQSLSAAENLPDTKSAIGLRTVLFSRALEQLSDELRETFLLHYEQELDVREVALVLEIPPGTVKSRLYTARNRLRDLLSESTAESAPPEGSRGESATPARPPTPVLVALEEKPL
jgi:RNA polymerase sigma-70 factor (ECF subfamily)